jgi:hypothetical protein
VLVVARIGAKLLGRNEGMTYSSPYRVNPPGFYCKDGR